MKSLIGSGVLASLTEPHAQTPGPNLIGSDPFDLLRVAITVKYGGNIREAAFKFTEEAEAILLKYGVNADAPAPALADKLEALKAAVGEATYDKLLVNPEVERMAMRAYRKASEVRSAKALDEIAALFNGALQPEELAYTLSELSESPDPIALLAEV